MNIRDHCIRHIDKLEADGIDPVAISALRSLVRCHAAQNRENARANREYRALMGLSSSSLPPPLPKAKKKPAGLELLTVKERADYDLLKKLGGYKKLEALESIGRLDILETT